VKAHVDGIWARLGIEPID